MKNSVGYACGTSASVNRPKSGKNFLTLPYAGKLTWIIHMVGAVIGGRVSFSATDDHDSMDGQLVIRVLQLMQLTDG